MKHVAYFVLFCAACSAPAEPSTPPTCSRTSLVLFVGNSLTRGFGATSLERTYPAVAMRSSSDPWENLGHDSETTSAMAAEAPGLVDVQAAGGGARVAVVWEGTNELFRGVSPADAYQHLADYCAGRRKAGMQVVLLTVLPMANAAAPNFERERLELNARLRAGYPAFADALVDVGGAPELQDPLGPLFTEDHIHLVDAGYGVVGGMVGADLEGR